MKNKSVILTTHSLAECEALAHKISQFIEIQSNLFETLFQCMNKFLRHVGKLGASAIITRLLCIQ